MLRSVSFCVRVSVRLNVSVRVALTINVIGIPVNFILVLLVA